MLHFKLENNFKILNMLKNKNMISKSKRKKL